MRCKHCGRSCTASTGRPRAESRREDFKKRRRRHGSFFTLISQRRSTLKAGGLAEFFLDAKELVVFGDAVGAAGGAGFDLAGGGGDGKVGDEGVFGFAGAVRNDGVVA